MPQKNTYKQEDKEEGVVTKDMCHFTPERLAVLRWELDAANATSDPDPSSDSEEVEEEEGWYQNIYICNHCGKQGSDDPDCSHCGKKMCVMLKQVFVKSN